MNIKEFRTLARVIEKEDPESIAIRNPRDSRMMRGLTGSFEDRGPEFSATLMKGKVSCEIVLEPEKKVQEMTGRRKEPLKTHVIAAKVHVIKTTTDKYSVEVE